MHLRNTSLPGAHYLIITDTNMARHTYDVFTDEKIALISAQLKAS